MLSVRDAFAALCRAVLEGGGGAAGPGGAAEPYPSEAGVVFVNIRGEIQSLHDLAASPGWDAACDRAVVEYLSVPNHRFGCADLDYHRFAPEPMRLGPAALPMHVFHILEAFSRTTPARYAALWLPLLDLAEAAAPAADEAHRDALRRARDHLRAQQQPGLAPAQSLDALLGNLVGGIPGLQTMVQQILGAAAEGGARADGTGPPADLGGMLSHVQGLLNPLLSQAAASATAEDPTLSPAIGQILTGFNALTQALMTPPPSAPSAVDAAGGGMMLTEQ